MEARDTQITARLAAQGALLYELQVIAARIGDDASREGVCHFVVDENAFHKASLAARKKLFTKLALRYFRTDTPELISHLIRQLRTAGSSQDAGLTAYATLLWNDGLALLLGTEWLAPRAGQSLRVATSDVTAELDRLAATTAPVIRKWSAATRRSVAQHYLGMLRDCGFATGSVTKTLRRAYVGPQVVGYAAALILRGGEPAAALPEHALFRAMGLRITEVTECLGQLGYRIQGGSVVPPARGDAQ